MPDRRLVQSFRRVAEAMLPEEQLRMERAVRAAIDEGGGIHPDAARTVTPLQTRDWWLPGAVSAGIAGMEPRVPQASKAMRIDASARTPPSGAAFVAEVTANGVPIDNVSIGIGESAGVSVMNHAIEPGAVLRVNVIQTGSAADVTVTLSYKPTLT